MSYRSEGIAAVLEQASGTAGVHIRERPETEPEPGMVAVRLRTAALNHLDLFTVAGQQRVKLPLVLCADGAGVVERSAGQRWQPGQEVVLYPVACDWTCDECRAGQQVFCPSFGILGEHVDGTACSLYHVPEQNLFPKPQSLSWEEAAAFPLTFLTAWRMLTTRAHLQPGETLLVVGASAGVGVAAVAIGRHLGARVLATSRSEQKRARLRELGADAVFDSADFSKAVREATGGRGAAAVFEHVGAATLDESLKALAAGGRIVLCGSTTGPVAQLNVPRLFFKQAALLGSTMGNAPEFEALLAAIEGGLRPVVDSVFPLQDIRPALEHIERAEHVGKVVLSIAG